MYMLWRLSRRHNAIIKIRNSLSRLPFQQFLPENVRQ
jgi:hypothetical protein